MRRAVILLSLTIILQHSINAQQALPAVVADDAKLEKLADGFAFTEGPTASASGKVYFTDQPNDRILCWSESRGLETFLQPAGRSNGLALDKDGNIWACADDKNELWIIRPDKSITRIASKYKGKLLNGPNDLWIAPDGGVFFTDPFYLRSWWDHTDEQQDCRAVYYLSPDRTTINRVESSLIQPNGIVGTPDGKTLFVADINAGKTYSFRIGADGSLSGKKLFCEMGSDGMTIDSKGNLYLTGKGVTVFDKNGKNTGNIAVPESWTANVCFGGKERKTLYITASNGFYRIKLKVKGTAG